MIALNSPLLRLPAGLDRKQGLFFDGMRHAAEVAELSYSRLRGVLTAIALDEPTRPVESTTRVAAFLDAWAFVDAVDRYRQLDLLLPNAKPREERDGLEDFLQATKQIRDVRNVADHLASRADHVVAQKGTALGELRWLTLRSEKEGLSCALIPGRMQDATIGIVNPAGVQIELPTDLIELKAGEHVAGLSNTYRALLRRVRTLEEALVANHEAQGVDLERDAAGADQVIRLVLAFS